MLPEMSECLIIHSVLVITALSPLLSPGIWVISGHSCDKDDKQGKQSTASFVKLWYHGIVTRSAFLSLSLPIFPQPLARLISQADYTKNLCVVL